MRTRVSTQSTHMSTLRSLRLLHSTACEYPQLTVPSCEYSGPYGPVVRRKLSAAHRFPCECSQYPCEYSSPDGALPVVCSSSGCLHACHPPVEYPPSTREYGLVPASQRCVAAVMWPGPFAGVFPCVAHCKRRVHCSPMRCRVRYSYTAALTVEYHSSTPRRALSAARCLLHVVRCTTSALLSASAALARTQSSVHGWRGA